MLGEKSIANYELTDEETEAVERDLQTNCLDFWSGAQKLFIIPSYETDHDNPYDADAISSVYIVTINMAFKYFQKKITSVMDFKDEEGVVYWWDWLHHFEYVEKYNELLRGHLQKLELELQFEK